MKVSVSRQKLATGLNLVSKATASGCTWPVLKSVLVSVDEDKLRLSATDLQLFITCWVLADVADDQDAVAVPANILNDLVRQFSNDATITISLHKYTKTLHVLCEASRTKINCIDAQEFPPLPSRGEHVFTVSGSKLKEMIRQTAFAVYTKPERPVLQGVLFEVEDSKLTLVATDGYRLSKSETVLSRPATKNMRVIVPAMSLKEIARIVDDDDEVLVSLQENYIVFRMADVEVASATIKGDFIDYKNIIPSPSTAIKVTKGSRNDFLKACELVEVVAREDNNAVKVTFSGNEVITTAKAESTLFAGAGETHFEVQQTGGELAMVFNVYYLLDVLSVLQSPLFEMRLIANDKPAVFSEETFTHLIMQMRLPD